jgi:hypothetical protein
MAMADDPLKNDLEPGTEEYALYEALRQKGIDIFTDTSLRLTGITGLKKYMATLGEKLKPNTVQNTDNALRLKQYIYSLITNINLQYHQAASAKAEKVRTALGAATGCLGRIADAIAMVSRIQNMPEAAPDAAREFQNILSEIDGQISTLSTRLVSDTEDSSFNEGKSGQTLAAQLDAIFAIREAMGWMVSLVVSPAWAKNSRNMQIFHTLYSTLCARGMAGCFFDNGQPQRTEDEHLRLTDLIMERACNAGDPPSAENNNSTFMVRYEQWLTTDRAVPEDTFPSKATMMEIVAAVNTQLANTVNRDAARTLPATAMPASDVARTLPVAPAPDAATMLVAPAPDAATLTAAPASDAATPTATAAPRRR